MILAILLLAGLATVLVLAQQAAKPDAPAEPRPFAPPSTIHPSVAFDVQRVEGATFTVSGSGKNKDSLQITLPASARVEVLTPITPADLHARDWMTVIGVPNAVKSFAIRSIVVVGSPGAPGADGIVLTQGGFAGNEAGRDPKELPILGGTVDRASSQGATLQTVSGPMTVDFAAAPPLRKVRAGSIADIHEGDRLACLTVGGTPDMSAVLVLAGGAN